MSRRTKIVIGSLVVLFVVGLLVFFLGPVLFASVAYPLPDNFQAPIANRAQQYGLNPNTLAALTYVESGFNMTSRSGAGAIGPTQFLPATADSVAKDLGVSPFSSNDLMESPDLAEWFAAFYVSRDVQLYGSLHVALVAYNGGGGAAEASLRGYGFAGPEAYADKIERIQEAYQAIYGDWWHNPTVTAATSTTPATVQFNIQANYSADVLSTVPATNIWQSLISGANPTVTNSNSSNNSSAPGDISNLWRSLLPQ